MKKLITIFFTIFLISCNVNFPIKVFYEENFKKLNDVERKMDANNPKNKFVVTFIGRYKNEDIKLAVDGKEVFHEKLNNKDYSTREFLISYLGDLPKENLQVFINEQSVTIGADKVNDKRYIIVDKDNYKKIFLSRSPIFKGSDNFYEDYGTKKAKFKIL